MKEVIKLNNNTIKHYSTLAYKVSKASLNQTKLKETTLLLQIIKLNAISCINVTNDNTQSLPKVWLYCQRPDVHGKLILIIQTWLNWIVNHRALTQERPINLHATASKRDFMVGRLALRYYTVWAGKLPWSYLMNLARVQSQHSQ